MSSYSLGRHGGGAGIAPTTGQEVVPTGVQPLTFRELLAYATAYLADHGIEDARSDAEVLIREAVGLSRARLYAHLDSPVAGAEWQKAEAFISRRANREPSAYIAGHKEFYGLIFQVDPRVLIPRPETEMLVDMGIAACNRLLAGRSHVTVADIGTGSGAIAISIAVNVTAAVVYAVDVSASALEVARLNCQRHGVEDRVKLLPGDLLRPVPAPIDIILANLPYIKDVDLAGLQPEIRHFEPAIALRGGKAGLSKIHRLLWQAGPKLAPDGLLALEIAWDQGRAAASLAKTVFPEARIEVQKDLAGLDRMIEIELGRMEDSSR